MFQMLDQAGTAMALPSASTPSALVSAVGLRDKGMQSPLPSFQRHVLLSVQAVDAGKLRASSPVDGCQSLPDNAQDIQGAIAFLERGTCMFAQKVGVNLFWNIAG